MKLLQNIIFVQVLMMAMVIWIVPMTYGHGHGHDHGHGHGHGHDHGHGHGHHAPVAGWLDARATFYGDINGGQTHQGACGYGDLHKQGFGLATAALSTALFNNGYTCGACYEIKCANSPQWCLPGSIKITATNFCPPDPSNKKDSWCNPPQKHFDLSQPMFLKIAQYKAGVVPVRYRRVHCTKTGGVKFEIKGNPHFVMVLPYNVGGAGDIKELCIKGTKTDWIKMQKNWGQIWNSGVVMTGQCLSFRITTSDGSTKDFMDVTPTNWGFNGQAFDGKINF
ncbi:PREDICTED: expansin-A24-like [Brassica oleracea var. oleracea]|uniref:expansin-A24-like n=1 Tax=Brassica oleracea var. oleracea TaxID=109376 RepID=UPI0006A712A6|nr:PREDICTED: expansin-A24-like [Brassica oleracea var. oleracea]